MKKNKQCSYSLSHKIVNAKRKFLECLLFREQSDGEMKSQKITDKPQQRNIFPLDLSEKSYFSYHKPTPVTWFRLFKNHTTE